MTAVHKANIMKLGDGLFLRCCEDVAKLYPNIGTEQSFTFKHWTTENIFSIFELEALHMVNLA